MLSEFDVNDSYLETAVTTAQPPGAIFIEPRSDDDCHYDVSSLPISDLAALLAECQAELDQQQRLKKRQVVNDLVTSVKAAMADGYIENVEELLDRIGTVQRKPVVAVSVTPTDPVRKPKSEPRYRSPVDPSRTWSGRGKRPDWLKTLINLYGEEAALEKCLIMSRDGLPFVISGDEQE